MKKLLEELASVEVVYTDGTKDTFEDVLANNCAGTAEVLDPYYKEILEASLNAKDDNDLEIEGVVAPIVSEIVKYSFYKNKEVFKDLIGAVLSLRSILDIEQEVTFEINENTIDLLHQVENMIHYFKNGWEIKDLNVKKPGDIVVSLSKVRTE